MPDKYVTDLTRSLRNYADRGDSAQESLTRQTVGFTGKNKLRIPASVVSTELNGVTVTVFRNQDGEVEKVRLNGTYTSDSYANFGMVVALKSFSDELLGKTWIASLEGSEDNNDVKFQIYNYNGSNGQIVVGVNGETSFTWSNSAGTGFAFNIQIPNGKNGAVFSNLDIYPMLRDARIKDSTYEPYHESVDVCKFDRAEQRVLGAKNLWDGSIPMSNNAGGTSTKTADGYDIQCTSTNNSGGYFSREKLQSKYTQYGIIKVAFEYKSDIACAGKIGAYPKRVEGVMPTTWTKYCEEFDASTIEHLTFYNSDTAQTPVISVRNIMIYLASDPDDTYVPYAMTNKELTDAVFVKNTITASDDLNNYIVSGLYNVEGSPQNSPANIGYYSLLVAATDSYNVRQMIIKGSSSAEEIYVRDKGGSPSVWHSWYKFTGTVVS